MRTGRDAPTPHSHRNSWTTQAVKSVKPAPACFLNLAFFCQVVSTVRERKRHFYRKFSFKMLGSAAATAFLVVTAAAAVVSECSSHGRGQDYRDNDENKTCACVWERDSACEKERETVRVSEKVREKKRQLLWYDKLTKPAAEWSEDIFMTNLEVVRVKQQQ